MGIDDLQRHQRGVQRLAFAVANRPDVGEDALQEAWVRALEAGATPPHSNVRGWFVTTARRLALNEARARRRRARRERASARPEVVPSSAEIASQIEVGQRLMAALERLEEHHAAVLRDRYLGDLSVREIADRDGLSEQAVRSRLRRARATLRTRLEQEGIRDDALWSAAGLPLISAASTSLPGAVPAVKKITLALVAIAATLAAWPHLAAVVDRRPTAQGDARVAVVPSSDDGGIEAQGPGLPRGAAARGRSTGAVDEPGPQEPGDCVIAGQVVDADSAPIARALVRLTSHEPWPGPSSARRVSDGRLTGFEASTDKEGRFRLDVPAPATTRTTLTIRAGRHLALHRTSFDDGDATDRPGIRPGLCDLGRIRLGATGAVLGRVLDSHGAPVAGARVAMTTREYGWIGEPTHSGEDGRFVMGHTPAGTIEVVARLSGYLSVGVEDIRVRVGRDSRCPDLVLEDAPSIAGTVVDQDGRPIADQRVTARPTAGGSEASGVSDARGRFEVFLLVDTPHSLTASRSGYVKFGRAREEQIEWPPGARDARVVLLRMDPLTLRVVDDVSGDAVEHYGVRIRQNGGSGATISGGTISSPPPIDHHPEGRAELRGRPSIDALVVHADGYLPFVGDVAPESGVQVVRLTRGARVRGRVLDDGRAVEDAAVVLEEGFVNRIPRHGVPGETLVVFSADRDSKISTKTDGDGRFAIAGAVGPEIRVRVDGGERGLFASTPVDFDAEAGEDLDLGVIELTEPGRVEGVVLVPPGHDAQGLVVHVDDWVAGPSTVTGSGGRFELDGLVPGTHTVVVQGRASELETTSAVAFEVADGGTTRLSIDMTRQAMCTVELLVTIDGEAAAGRGVDVDPPVVPGVERRTGLLGAFGRCDADGRVRGPRRMLGTADVRITLGLVSWAHPSQQVDLSESDVVDATVAFETAAAEFVLPDGAGWPSEGRATVRFLRPGSRAELARYDLRLSDGEVVRGEMRGASLDGARLRLDRVVAGDVIAAVTVVRADDAFRVEIVDGQSVHLPPRPEIDAETRVRIEPGTTARVELTKTGK